MSSRSPVKPRRAAGIVNSAMDNELVRRLTWSGMLTIAGALATLLASRVAAIAYRRIFDEDPPE